LRKITPRIEDTQTLVANHPIENAYNEISANSFKTQLSAELAENK